MASEEKKQSIQSYDELNKELAALRDTLLSDRENYNRLIAQLMNTNQNLNKQLCELREELSGSKDEEETGDDQKEDAPKSNSSTTDASSSLNKQLPRFNAAEHSDDLNIEASIGAPSTWKMFEVFAPLYTAYQYLEIEKITDYFNIDSSKTKTAVVVLASGLMSATLLLGTVYIGKVWYSFRYFKHKGIKTPPRTFWNGNLEEILENNLSDCLYKWTKEFGEVYGYYEGHRPYLVTSNLEMMHEILMKKCSSSFMHRRLPLQLPFYENSPTKENTKIVDTVFSSDEVKDIFPLMQFSTSRLHAEIKKNVGQVVNFSELADRMALESVFNTAFGLDIDLQGNADYLFLTRTRSALKKMSHLTSNVFYAGTLFYELRPIFMPIVALTCILMKKVRKDSGESFYWVFQKACEIIKDRISNRVQSFKADYLKILLDKYNINKFKMESDADLNEVKLNITEFWLSTFEITSNLVSNAIHALAVHQGEQEQLISELDKKIPHGDEVDFDTLFSLNYLDLFVKEVLRKYPVGSAFFNRQCFKPTTVGNYKITKNLIVAFDTMTLYNKQEYWGNVSTDQFFPLRFQDPSINERARFLFEINHKRFIEIRCAFVQTKLVLVNLLRDFSVASCVHMPRDLIFEEGVGLRRSSQSIGAMFVKRQRQK